MNLLATNSVTDADLPKARLGPRFGRMDLTSQLALLVVEPFAEHFASLAQDRIAIVLAARASSLSTDAEYWSGRDNPGGVSPTLFTYTLPSAAIGEVAIRHRLTGPNLCLVGSSREVLPEAADLIRRGEAAACVCISVDAVSPRLAALTGLPPAARACAVLLQGTGLGQPVWRENDRDMEALCATLRGKISTK